MNKFCKRELTIRLGGYIFGLLYLLQVTVLPLFHYQMHVNERCDNGRDHHSHQSDVSSPEKKKHVDHAEIFEYHQSAEDDHSSHHSDSCSLCLGVHKGATVSINVTTLEIKFLPVVDAINYDKLPPHHYSSSNPPRGPPASLS